MTDSPLALVQRERIRREHGAKHGPAEEQVEALADAMCQVLNELADGNTVCDLVKARATIAMQPFLLQEPPAMSPDQKYTLEVHLAWLSQYAADDADFQERNWRDNMMSVRAQVAQMRRDFGLTEWADPARHVPQPPQPVG